MDSIALRASQDSFTASGTSAVKDLDGSSEANWFLASFKYKAAVILIASVVPVGKGCMD